MSSLVIEEATERAAALRSTLASRVVISDGAMGTMIQASDATLDDFEGHEGCNEVLNVTRPDVIVDIHRAYLATGADCVTTNTFGTNLANLGEYGITERIGELAEAGARLARQATDEFTAADGRLRWVIGSMGPGTKLPTLGHITFRELRDSYYENAAGLLRGGADALIIETCPDLLQAKAAIIGAKRAVADAGAERARHRVADHRDDRHHAARDRDRRGADRPRAARHRHDRPQLRDRPGRDERAPALPGRELADPDLLPAQRRAARADLRRRLLPALARRAGRRARPVHQRVRPVAGRRLLRHHPRAHRRAGRPARPPPRAGRCRGRWRRARPRPEPGRRVPLQPRAVPAGHRVPRDRRADQRQRVQGVPRGDDRRQLRGLRVDRQVADPRRRAPARRLHRLRRPGRRGRHARDRRAARHRRDAAAGARLDRARGDRGGPRADRRPLGRQLGQLRGRRRPGLPDRQADAGDPRARRGGGRADDRRARPGPHRAVEDRGRRAADQRPDRELGDARAGHHPRLPHLPDRHRPGGDQAGRDRDDRGDRRAQAASPERADHPRPVQRLVRPQARRPRRC